MVDRVVLLDAGPIGLATNPKLSPQSLECAEWLHQLMIGGVQVMIPEIADYEVRRELLRAKKNRGLRKLDDLCGLADYLPINTAGIRCATQFWTDLRQQGRPTADDFSLDADMILAGQALTLGIDVVVATTNLAHLSRVVPAKHWHDIVL
ncbi:MAG: nuclease [Planctomycetaceae bacterium]